MYGPSIRPGAVGRTLGAGGLVLGAALATTDPVGSAAVGMGAMLAVPGGRRDMLVLVGSIFLGAALGGILAIAGTTVVEVPVPETVTVGLAVAAGGGMGAVLQLVSGEEPTPRDETMTVDREVGGSESGSATPSGPQPADLFAESPDAMIYYGTEGDTPVVRTVNPVFVELFGEDGADAPDAPLADVLPAGDAEGVLAAVRAGDSYEATIEDGADGRAYLLRVAGVADDTGARGYVIYTPLDR